MLVCVKENIIVPSVWLNHRLKSHILADLKTKKSRTYSKIHGYIKDVVEIKKIHNAYVSFADSTNRFTIEYLIDIIKPSPGVTCQGKIIGIYEQGLFIDVDGFQALVIVDIKHNTAHHYMDLKHKKVRLCECGEKTVGDWITMVIQDVEFKGNQLSCVGKHEHHRFDLTTGVALKQQQQL